MNTIRIWVFAGLVVVLGVSLLPALAPASDLVLSATVAPPSAPPGTRLAFQLSVTNAGSEPALLEVDGCPVRFRIDGRYSPRWECEASRRSISLAPGESITFDPDQFPQLLFDPRAYPLAPGSHRVILAVEGLGGAEAEFTVEPPGPEGFAAGRVLGTDGAPLTEGIVVLSRDLIESGDALTPYGPNDVDHATLGDEGRFLITNIEPGAYLMRVVTEAGVLWYPGVTDPLRARRLEISGGTFHADITLAFSEETIPRYPVTGKVTERTRFLPGQPVAGAVVLAVPQSGPPRAVSTGENGAFRFDLPEGRYRLVAGKLIKNRYRYWDDGSGSSRRGWIRVSGDTDRVRIELAPLGNAPLAILTGQVLSLDIDDRELPRPLAKAEVVAVPLLPSADAEAAPHRTETNQDGVFVLEIPPDTPYVLEAHAPGHQSRVFPGTARREEGSWIDVEPGRRHPGLGFVLIRRSSRGGGAVEGSVLRALSEEACRERNRATCLEPAAGVWVRLSPAYPTSVPFAYRARVGLDGRFLIDSVPRGSAGLYYLAVEDDQTRYFPGGVRQSLAEPIPVPAGKTFDAGRMVLPAPTAGPEWVEGTVLDTQGRPIEDAIIRVYGDSALSIPITTRTDRDGVFRVPDLVPGYSFRIAASAEGYIPQYYPSRYRWIDAEVLTTGKGSRDVEFVLTSNPTDGVLLQTGRVLGIRPSADDDRFPMEAPLPETFVFLFDARMRMSSKPVAGGTTGENGSALLSGLAEGTFFLMADHPGFATSYYTGEESDHPVPIHLRRDGPSTGAEIRLEAIPRETGPLPEPDEPVVVTSIHNVPNPFRPQTTIRYRLEAAAPVSLQVFDYRGRLVRTLLAEQEQIAGPQQLLWDGRDEDGKRVSSGVYFYRILAGSHSVSRKMVVLP